MKSHRMLIMSAVVVTGLLALATGVYAYDGGREFGCPENYFHPEYGCQVAPDIAYVEEEEPVEVATVRGCPAEYFNSEYGCQIDPEREYVEEFALVKEEAEVAARRGCPAEFFHTEFGCQLFNIEMNP